MGPLARRERCAPADLATGARLLNALLSLLTVALVHAVASRLYGRRAGLLAAGLLALSPLAWATAWTAAEDALAALVALAAFWSIAQVGDGWGRGTAKPPGAPSLPRGLPSSASDLRSYSAFRAPHAAFMLGFAAGVRPALTALAAPLLLALWWRRAARPRGAAWGGALITLVAGYLVAVPYAIAALPTLLDAAAVAAREYELRPAPAALALLARNVPAALATLAGADPLLALLGGLGTVWALGRRGRADLLLLAFLVPFGLLLLLRRAARHPRVRAARPVPGPPRRRGAGRRVDAGRGAAASARPARRAPAASPGPNRAAWLGRRATSGLGGAGG